MPAALIEVRREWSEADEIAIIDAVHESLVAAFRIPPQDKHVRLISYPPHRFACSPRLEQPEFATLVTIDCFAGRSVDAKRALYAEICERLAVLSIPKDHVTITVRDSPTEDWGIRGGQAACDVDLGFTVNV
jgi:phenylpyruvate tautomerase PptA (4-oxalocrotonate tautomerase family)